MIGASDTWGAVKIFGIEAPYEAICSNSVFPSETTDFAMMLNCPSPFVERGPDKLHVGARADQDLAQSRRSAMQILLEFLPRILQRRHPGSYHKTHSTGLVLMSVQVETHIKCPRSPWVMERESLVTCM